MPGYINTTEVGYDVYVGSAYVANPDTYSGALAALKSCPLWNGQIVRGTSRYMPCQ